VDRRTDAFVEALPAGMLSKCVLDGETWARWSCARHQRDITPEEQQEACVSAHLVIPGLLSPFAEPVDAGDDWIEFKNLKDGATWRHGSEAGMWTTAELTRTPGPLVPLARPAPLEAGPGPIGGGIFGRFAGKTVGRQIAGGIGGRFGGEIGGMLAGGEGISGVMSALGPAGIAAIGAGAIVTATTLFLKTISDMMTDATKSVRAARRANVSTAQWLRYEAIGGDDAGALAGGSPVGGGCRRGGARLSGGS
jgi:hypothetical protein